MTDREAVFVALQLAIEWELSSIDANQTGPVLPEEQSASIVRSQDNIKAFRRVLYRRYGTDGRTPAERLNETLQPVDFYKVPVGSFGKERPSRATRDLEDMSAWKRDAVRRETKP